MNRRDVALAMGVLLTSTAAAAADGAGKADKDEARRRFEVGVAEAKAGAYREAIADFQRAYELSPNFAVLYNVATAQAALGDSASALASYERYLAEGGAKIPDARKVKVTAEMKDLVPRTGSIVVRVSPDGARVTVDGAPVDAGAIAAAQPIRVNIGIRKLAATLDGHVPVDATVTVESGDVAKVTLTLSIAGDAAASPGPAALPPPVIVLPPPAPEPRYVNPSGFAPPVDEASSRAQRIIGYAFAGAGLVGLGVGGVLYLVAKSNFNKAVADGCSQDLSTCTGNGATEWQNAKDGVTHARVAAIIGGALIAGGLTFYITAPSSPGAPAGVALSGRW
jgi:tetratricopeptide (TPR) repeat protein